MNPLARLTHQDYTVGWICALPSELTAAMAMLDEQHLPLVQHPAEHPADDNTYTLGRVDEHNVVIACLPAGKTGTNSAARVAAQMRYRFRGIRFGLMVGIGGGVPSADYDIRLGDVVISKPGPQNGGVVQYDFGKTVAEGRFVHTGFLNSPPNVLLAALNTLQAQHDLRRSRLADYLKATDNPRLQPQFGYQSSEYDQLFLAEYDHVNGGTACEQCDVNKRVVRPPRDNPDPVVYCGTIASGNQVMKHGATRDRLAREFGVICFEMEAAGLMNDFPCIVIRGICDYADSHKNKRWQKYAAATAAACAKELLSIIPPNQSVRKIIRNESPIEDEENRACLHALFVTNPLDDMERIQDTNDNHLEGTCSWILNDPIYKEWLQDEQSNILWVHGDPGKGKTMLAISQVRKLADWIKGSTVGSATLSYFFCDNRDDRRKDAVVILRGLLYQLLCQRPEMVRYLRGEYETQKDKLFLSSTAQQSLWRILERMLSQFTDSTTWFVIDALDECEPESRRILLQRIKTHINQEKKVKESTSNHRVKWFLTSRNESLIKESMTGCLHISLESNSEAVARDVQQFIEAKVQELDETKEYRKDLKISISQTLQTKAEDTFLWVSLACAELRKVPQIKAIEVLQRMPSGLNAFYEQLLSRVLQNRDKEIADFVREILVATLVAVRPLTLYELAVTAGLPAEHRNDAKLLQEYAEQCGSFLSIRQQAVYFVHQSAKDFLSSTNALALSTDLAEENKRLTIRCFDYICSGVFQAGEIESNISNVEDKQDTMGLNGPSYGNAPKVLEYPVLFWIAHARLASPDFVESQPFDKDQEFFLPTSHLRDSWLCAYWSDAHMGSESRPDNFSSMHLAAYSGILPLVIKIQQWQPHTIDWKDFGGRTALQWAAQRGHDEVVRLLLDYKADVNIQDELGNTALHRAADGGYEAVVRLLLDYGADVAKEDRNRCTALFSGVLSGHKAVVRLLLDHGADINAKGYNSRMTLLNGAAYRGNEDIVRLLLVHGADLNGKGHKAKCSVLHLAAWDGCSDMVRLLLDYGPDIDMKGSKYDLTPLHWAAEFGHEAVVRLLLDHGADVEAKVHEYEWTAFKWAIDGGHEAVAQLLLEHGANIDAEMSENEWTVLQWAARFGQEAIVRLLLELGADVNAQDVLGNTALHRAADGCHLAVVQLLFEHGADMNLQNVSGDTVLHRLLYPRELFWEVVEYTG